MFKCTWAQDEHSADLHMAQPNVPVSKTGHIPPPKLWEVFVKVAEHEMVHSVTPWPILMLPF
jgi:hypothetical protein